MALWRILLAALLCSLPGFAARSLSTGTSNRSYVADASWKNRTAMRVEFAFEWSSCADPAHQYAKWFRLTGFAIVGCGDITSSQDRLVVNNGIATGIYVSNAPGAAVAGGARMFAHTFVPRATYLMRIQRYPDLTLTFTIFGTGGSPPIETITLTHGNSLVSIANDAMLWAANPSAFRWVRLYSTLVPDDSISPLDSGYPPGDLGNWEFEDSAKDSSGKGVHLTPDPEPQLYSESPVFPATVQIAASGAAGEDVMLKSASFTWDGKPLTGWLWDWISGPAEPVLSRRTDPALLLTGAVAGTHSIRLTVLPSNDSRTVQVKIPSLDSQGHYTVPTTPDANVPQYFSLANIPGAVTVRLTSMKSDGGTLPPVDCTTSPCSVPVDTRQRSARISRTYLDASGKSIVSTGEEVRFPQSSVPPYANGGDYSSCNTLPYGVNSRTEGETMKYLASRCQSMIGGSEVYGLLYNPDVYASTYTDQSGSYLSEHYENIVPSAKRHGFRIEDLFLHARANYTQANGRIYKLADLFDAGETGNASAAVDGVIVDGIDKSVAAYSTTVADVPIKANAMMGYFAPYSMVSFTLSTGSVSNTVSWQYCTASAGAACTQWSNLTLAADTTNKLAQTGTVRFTPPVNWVQSVESGVHAKYWSRVSVSGSGRKPVASRIYGDSWMTAGKLRGWDATSSTILNAGTDYEYNPTPPAHATATHKYQSRVMSFWANDNMFWSLLAQHNGRYLMSLTTVDRIRDRMNRYNGVMIDNGVPWTTTTPPIETNTEYAGVISNTQESKTQAAVHVIKQSRAYAESLKPGFHFGVNHSTWDLCRNVRWCLQELINLTHLSPFQYGSFSQLATSHWASAGPWQSRPENNPDGVRIAYQITDNKTDADYHDGTWVYWDRAIRGPMMALATYLAMSHKYLSLTYQTLGGFIYSEMDTVYVADAAPTWTLTETLQSSTVNGAVATGDFTSFPTGESTVRLGPTGEFVKFTRTSATTLTAMGEKIMGTYEAGTGLHLVRAVPMNSSPVPPVERVMYWGKWFPAMSADVGTPDASGYNGGAPQKTHEERWQSAEQSGTRDGIRRRDYTKAIILAAACPSCDQSGRWSWYDTYSSPITFASEGMPATLYPLRPDGRTGTGITSIRLRSAEGVVLMKAPIN